MNPDESDQAKEELRIRRRLDLLFSRYLDQDPTEDLSTAADYLDFLASRIDYVSLSIDMDPSLLNKFEVVWLLLEDRLQPYPDKIKQQLHDLLRGDEVSELFAVFSQLQAEDLEKRKLRELLHLLPAPLTWLLWLFKPLALARGGSPQFVSADRLLAARTALFRAANILKFATTINFVDYDTSLRDFKDHYNPGLVDKGRLSALISILQVEVQELDDPDVRGRLLGRLDELEEEIRKERPRWGAIIAGFFILFGFVADLKTVNPHAYENTHKVLEKIVSVLHEDPKVQTATERRGLPVGDSESKEDPDEDPKRPPALLPKKEALGPRDDDEE